MKNILLLLLICNFTMQSCIPPPTSVLGYTYAYKFSLRGSEGDTSMYFRDKNISVAFGEEKSGVAFRMTNISNDILKVNWNEAVFVQDGEVGRAVHTGTKYADIEKEQIASIILPSTTLSDQVVPAKNIKYTLGNWEVSDLYITDDLGMKDIDSYFNIIKGDKFSVYLPIIKNGIQLDYTFAFTVEGVTRTPKKGQKIIDERASRAPKVKDPNRAPIIGPKRAIPKR